MKKNSLIAFFLGFIFLVGAFIFLEWRQPYYFTQDDNFAQFFPIILQACRSFFQDGIFPTWNPHQFMGMPTWSIGTYALSYPPTYLSYAIATFVLKNPYTTLEVFCIFHLILGYVAFFNLLRFLKVDSFLSSAGALCFVLSGFSLIAGRSWYYMTPVVFWAPFIFYLFEKIREVSTKKQLILFHVLLGLSIGLFFHAGNAQMWIYTLLFLFFYFLILIFTKKLLIRDIFQFLPGVLFSLSLVFILLFPQMEVTSYAQRSPWGNGILKGALSLFLPYPLSLAEHPQGWGPIFREDMTQFYYSGTTFILASFLGLFGFVFHILKNRFRNTSSGFIENRKWLILFFISFLLSMGGFFWNGLSALPFFNKMSCPFKFLAFANFFSVISGSLLFHQFSQKKKLIALISVVTLGLISWHLTHVRSAFYSYGDKPYPELPQKIEDILKEKQRVMPLAPGRNLIPGYVFSLKHNFPSIYGFFSFDGYEPFVPWLSVHSQILELVKKKPDEALVRYGISYLVVHDENSFKSNMIFLRLRNNLDFSFEDGPLKFYKMKDPVDPLVFNPDDLLQILNPRFKSNGIEVALNGNEKKVIFNFASDPHLEFKADGNKLSYHTDSWGRIEIIVPEGAKELRMAYIPPVKKALVFSLVSLFFGFSGLFFLKVKKCPQSLLI